MKNINSLNTTAFLAALISAVIVVAASHPIVHGFQINQELKENCKNYNLSKSVEKRIHIDIEDEVVTVNSTELMGRRNVAADGSIRLPLKKTEESSEYNDCSAEAREILLETQQVYADYLEGSCKDFATVITGEVPVPVKNGIKANVNAAKEFYNQFCKK